jgi:tetratricopeptide (TPR) repeat protein
MVAIPRFLPGVSTLLRRMLATGRVERPQDAGALAYELSALADAVRARGRRRRAAAALEGEQVVGSVVAVRVPAGGVVPKAVPFVAESFGATSRRLAPDTFVATIHGKGTPTDLASQAARCALSLKTTVSTAAFSIATGRLQVSGKASGGDAADQAIALLGDGRSGDIRLDKASTSLLSSRFRIRDGARPSLLGEDSLVDRPRTVLGKEIPCIGRDRELGTLMSLWEECTAEPVARTVLVTAPAGAGKSRVRHELLDRIQRAGAPVETLIGRGDALRAGAQFAMLAPALRAAAGLVGGEVPTVAQKRLLTHVGRHVSADKARRVSAFIGEIADLPFPDDDLPALRAARQDPLLMSDQILAAWLDYLEAACGAQPVLLVLEDLHWGDAPSVQFVDAAVRTLRNRPLMVLAFARPEVDDKFPNLWVERDLQRISLPPLTPRSAQKLVKAALPEMSAARAVRIVERADGNPFYLEELIRAVAAGAGEQVLPDTVIGMVQARLSTLGPEAKRVLRAGAVFGETFRPAGVRHLLGQEHDGNLDQWLDVLIRKEMLFSRRAADTCDLVFRHALMQEAAYDMITAEDRVLGHRLAGEYLESVGEREAILLVEHFERGGQPMKAAHWCRFAAEQALDANDLGQVIVRAERGVRLGAEAEVLGATRLAEAQARFWRGEYCDAEACAAEALRMLKGAARLLSLRELIAALGQQARFSELALLVEEERLRGPEPTTIGAWLDCLVRASGYLLPGGLYPAALTIVAEVESRAAGLEPASRARLDAVKATLAWHEGNQPEAVSRLEAAAKGYESLGDVRSSTEVLANLAAASGDLGLLEEAEERLCAALSLAERMELRVISAAVLMNLAMLRAQLGKFDEAETTGKRAVELARRQGDPRIEGVTDTYLSISSLFKGSFLEAESYARAATALLAHVSPQLPAALAALSQALLHQGDTGSALDLAQKAYRMLEEHGRVEDGEALVRLAYAKSLAASGSVEGALAVIAVACARLEQRAAAIKNPVWRRSFLSRLPEHAETFSLRQRLENTHHGSWVAAPELRTIVPQHE